MRWMTTSLMALACVGCAPIERAATAPLLAAYFDCVRNGGAAISAHRAVSAPDQPENSLAAIRATGRAIPGAILEIDAVATADGTLVLMHDESLDRTTTGTGRVADLTLAEIRRARLTAENGDVTDEPPPTVAEALAEAGRVGAIASIDLKAVDASATEVLARRVVAEVRRAGAAGRVVLITYSTATARTVARMAPEMMISVGVNDPDDLAGLDTAQVLGWTGSREARPDLWRALDARGVEAQFGTLGPAGQRLDDRYARDGSVSEYRELVAQGVTVIATDAPLAVLGVLGPEIAAAARCPR